VFIYRTSGLETVGGWAGIGINGLDKNSIGIVNSMEIQILPKHTDPREFLSNFLFLKRFY
jgi:hypothetical protein